MADLALPQSLSISDTRRNAMPAIRRTVLHGSTSQNVYGAGELVYIPVDTGTAGAFFVPETSRLDMTVNVYNKNYFVDFINLPRCGFHALIEEFGIEIHNSLHENQRFYAEMIEMEMVRNGENMVPFEMTVSNPHDVGGGIAGVLHINFIKPSMVTTAGLPHGVKYSTMQHPQGSNVTSSVPDIITQGLLLNSNPYLKQPLGRNGYGTIANVTYNGGVQSGGTVGYDATLGLANRFGLWANTGLPTSSSYDDRIATIAQPTYTCGITPKSEVTVPAGQREFPPRVSNMGAVGGTANGTVQIPSGTSYGYDLSKILPSRFTGYNAAGGNYSKMIPRIDPNFGTLQSDNSIFDVHYGQTVGGYTPMMWPAKQPCNMEKLLPKLREARRGVNTKNVQNYYAHCKNIVVSIPVDLTSDPYGQTAIWGPSVHTLPGMSDKTKGQLHSFRVSLKLYSCLLGVYAKKWFPSLLIGAGRMRIRMRLQQPNIAFQTLMDPCRVVPGTARDKYPYLGIHHSGGTSISQLVNADVSSIAHSVHPIMVSNYIPGSCYNDLIAMGRFPIPQIRMKAMNEPFGISHHLYRRGGGVGQVPIWHKDTMQDEGYFYTEKVTVADQNFASLVCGPNLKSGDTTKDNSYFFHWQALTPLEGATSGEWLSHVQHEMEYLHKMIADLNYELHRNSHYGFPPNPLKYESGLLVPIENYENVNAPDAHTLPIVDGKTVGTVPSTIGSLQNYQYHTDFTSSFIKDPEATTYAYNAGDHDTAQLIFHPSSAEYVLATSGVAPTGDGDADGSFDMMGDATPPAATFTHTGALNPAKSLPLPSDGNLNSLNWDPFCHPQPQYAPVISPWDKGTARQIGDSHFVNENAACYGTFLERSVAQVRRTNQNLFALKVSGQGAAGITERLTYTVSNIVYRVEEIILPESASMQIIASAMEGGITIEADTIKSIETILQKQDNQKILLNVSAGIVNDICFCFQPTEMLQGDKAYGYNSFATYCPWTSFQFVQQKEGTKLSTGTQIAPAPDTPDEYNWLGGDPQFYNALTQGDNIAINTFLSIATEYFPRNPINDLNTLLDHITWGDQHRGYVEYLGLDPVMQNTYDTSNFQAILPFQDGFFSVFTPIECLDDQTITDNPYFTPLECNLKRPIRGKRAIRPALPFFKPFDGTFHLAFNLQAFMHQEERMNVGTPMVNNNSYLNMQNCHMIRMHETRMITFIRCFARVVIERGGIVQIFT